MKFYILSIFRIIFYQGIFFLGCYLVSLPKFPKFFCFFISSKEILQFLLFFLFILLRIELLFVKSRKINLPFDAQHFLSQLPKCCVVVIQHTVTTYKVVKIVSLSSVIDQFLESFIIDFLSKNKAFLVIYTFHCQTDGLLRCRIS